MKRIFERIGRIGRHAVLALAILCTSTASADFLWWTVDFGDDWGNEGELQSNPAGVGATGYEIYLVVKDSGGNWVQTISGGALANDCLDEIYQLDVTNLGSDSYTFFVEMVKSGEGASATRYLSPEYTYADLVADGHISPSLEALEVVWNPAVGGAWAVPEPTSGMLMLLGVGLLMLRRKRDVRFENGREKGTDL